LGVSFQVDDPTGRSYVLPSTLRPFTDSVDYSEYFSVYNLPLPGIDNGEALDALFPVGSILAVKEPLFKMNQNGSNAMVRVDSPTDVVFLEPSSPVLQGVEWVFPTSAVPPPPSFDFKAHGNALLVDRKFLLGVKAYSDGLAASPSDEQKLLLHLKRAQAHLLLRNFGAAYRDASAVLVLFDNDVNSPPQTKAKATLRQARALEGLRKLDLALQAYNDLLQIDPDKIEGKDGKKRVEKMLRESKTGEYDWRALEKDKIAKPGPGLNVGDFVGPIRVVEMSERGGGRGIIASRDIAAGELLLCSFPFSFLLSPLYPSRSLEELP